MKVESFDVMIAIKLERLIKDSLNAQHSVNYYAERLHISAEPLNRICKFHYQMSVHELQNARLLEEAERLLLTTLASGKEIAYILGFCDPPYFTRWFGKMRGMSPMAYRLKCRS